MINPNLVASSPEAVPAPVITAKPATPDKGGFIWGTGRRKSSVARVRVKPGTGKLKINDREVNDYFSQEQDRNAVIAPLKATDTVKGLDVFVNVKGGGTTGQAGATMLGIARALKNYDPSLLKALRDGGYLTRDSRMVERKKPGKPGARRSFQFSKR
jgi:small subunit ribosomal protein S9